VPGTLTALPPHPAVATLLHVSNSSELVSQRYFIAGAFSFRLFQVSGRTRKRPSVAYDNGREPRYHPLHGHIVDECRPTGARIQCPF